MLPELILPQDFLRLGIMGWPLVACSVLALALCLERAVFFVANRWRKAAQFTSLCAQLERYKEQPKGLRDEALSLMLQDLQGQYFNGLQSLRIIGAISPMIGLLGTILGIITAFKVIAQHPGPVSANAIADGLGEAMLTTAAGLMIALPALLLAHYFQFLGNRQLGDFSLRLNRLSLSLAMQSEQSSDAPVKPARVKTADITQREQLILSAAKLLR
mgnify:CR=1 FL=1